MSGGYLESIHPERVGGADPERVQEALFEAVRRLGGRVGELDKFTLPPQRKRFLNHLDGKDAERFARILYEELGKAGLLA
ncbi:hypothetical protein Srot_1034 [Segniliparus rotundus DSM 44985]|uniref:Uncharacterized protein n=2 Tax=Segniliparus rotundus TaxID=286802 RepID=D6ZEY3_SEGRD|nr:hypothetical protein Srot_1034 [Segniliparus rotundus DSM 44985]